MKSITVDVAVIGAGTAGLAAYRAAVAAGKRSVIIEAGPYGTTCARVGCMPSKLLIAAADAAHVVSKWPAFGIRLAGAVHIDGQAVMARVQHERDRFVGFVLQGVEAIPARDKVQGPARFLDDQTLMVADHTRIHFSQAVIATGSSPAIPALLRNAGKRLLVNDDIFAWKDLPRSVAIFGPGVIGLELGQALQHLGVKVHMFGRQPMIGPVTDPVIRRYASGVFQQVFTLFSQAPVHAIEAHDDGVAIRYKNSDNDDQSIVVDYVIATTGRTPNVDKLGLEHTSLKRDALGTPLFRSDTLQCGDSPIFIAGDANNALPVLHEAADEGRIAGNNAANYPNVRPGLRRTPLAIIFTDPQIALVGARYADLTPGRFITGEVSFEDQGRSRVMLRHQGRLHVYVDCLDGRLRGAEMMAPDAEHLAHLLAWAIQAGLTVDQALDMPFYHPVVEEGLRTALRDAQDKLHSHAYQAKGGIAR